MCDTTHPFEKAGLGIAPFHFVSMTENVYVPAPGAPAVAGGCCDYCYTGIRYEYWIQSSDGKRFKVGCDCVLKLDRADNKLVSVVKKEKAKLDAKLREEKKKKEIERVNAAFDMLENSEALQRKLDSQPHPKIDKLGFTLYSYVYWMRENAGHSGRMAIARIIEKANV